jgi:hypothetical protein
MRVGLLLKQQSGKHSRPENLSDVELQSDTHLRPENLSNVELPSEFQEPDNHSRFKGLYQKLY